MIYTTDIIGYQWDVFIKSLNLGMILGLCYDVPRIIGSLHKFKRRFYIISDLIYFVWAAFLAFSFLLNENYGMPRFYIFFGAGIGFLFWYMTFGKINLFLAGIVKRILSAVFLPFIKIFRRILKSLSGRLENKKIFYQKVVIRQKILLKKRAGMVYNILCLNISKAFSFCGEKAGKEPKNLESNGTEKTENESFSQGSSYRIRGLSSYLDDIDSGGHQREKR